MGPYLKSTWPRTTDITSRAIAESLARLSLAAGSEFPQAYTRVRPWMKPIAFPDQLVRRIHESGICADSPEPALDLLRKIMDHNAQCPRTDLEECLKALRTADPSLEEAPRFVWLVDYLRQHGGHWD